MYVIVGDLNSRIGTKIHDLVNNNNSNWKYEPVDPQENDNGKKLFSICKDNGLMVANNLITKDVKLTSSLTSEFVTNGYLS